MLHSISELSFPLSISVVAPATILLALPMSSSSWRTKWHMMCFGVSALFIASKTGEEEGLVENVLHPSLTHFFLND